MVELYFDGRLGFENGVTTKPSKCDGVDGEIGGESGGLRCITPPPHTHTIFHPAAFLVVTENPSRVKWLGYKDEAVGRVVVLYHFPSN